MRRVFDLIYPRLCVFCKSKLNPSSEYNICTACAAGIKPIKVPFCLKCGTGLEHLSQIRQNGCSQCASKKYYFDQALSACKYKGMVKHCIHLFKYKRKRKTGILLGDILVRFLKDNFCEENIDLITAVPLHKHKLQERGFNQSEIIANKLSEYFKIKNSFNNLCRIKKTTAQVTLTARQRQLNTAGAFSCKHPEKFQNKRILLIDDIFTTGSTLNECARVLKESGAKSVTCLTIAR
ncbi:MAG: ComF family protein [Candidatus Omnitrophota bacterium]